MDGIDERNPRPGPASREPELDEEFPEVTEEMWATAVRGKYAAQARKRCNVVTIEEELRELFPTERAVNDALRTLLAGMEPREPVVPPIEGSGFTHEQREQVHDYDRPW